jgi:hypothetical protein
MFYSVYAMKACPIQCRQFRSPFPVLVHFGHLLCNGSQLETPMQSRHFPPFLLG